MKIEKALEKYQHKKQYRHDLSRNISLCFDCSSAIVRDKSGNDILTVRPINYQVRQENSFPLFLSVSDEHSPYPFINKSEYLTIRNSIIKGMKTICSTFQLEKKTYFLSLDYFDRICSKMKGFDKSAFEQIAKLCIILAAKFQENGVKGAEIQRALRGQNYAKDELYVLQLLNYELQNFTAYDILIDTLYTGFLFDTEKFSIRKMNMLYSKIENILYIFSESKYYIDMTYKEIALSIIGFIRELLVLTPFTKEVQLLFMNDFVDIHNYLHCLSRIKKCFKFKEEKTQHANSAENTTDSNSDNSLDKKKGKEVNNDKLEDNMDKLKIE
jgi:hypothetical protein